MCVKCLVLDDLGFLLDAPYVAAPHHGLDTLLLSLDAPHHGLDALHMVLDGLDLELGFHSVVSLGLFHQEGLVS